MPWFDFIWDDEENVAHLAEHGLKPEEVADVVRYPDNRSYSRSSGLPVAFGYTPTGRYVCVVYQQFDSQLVYIVTAYDVEP